MAAMVVNTWPAASHLWRGRIDRPLPAWTACISHNNFSSRPVALTVAEKTPQRIKCEGQVMGVGSCAR
jgi:hypothetical protein